MKEDGKGEHNKKKKDNQASRAQAEDDAPCMVSLELADDLMSLIIHFRSDHTPQSFALTAKTCIGNDVEPCSKVDAMTCCFETQWCDGREGSVAINPPWGPQLSVFLSVGCQGVFNWIRVILEDKMDLNVP